MIKLYEMLHCSKTILQPFLLNISVIYLSMTYTALTLQGA